MTIQYNLAKLYGFRRSYTLDSEAHSKGRGGTRTIDVMSAIRAKIAGRALGAGDRLPSIRSLAAVMGSRRPRWWKPMIASPPRG